MNRLSLMTTRTVPISDPEASSPQKAATKKTSAVVRFSQPEANMIVPPTQPLSALEKRSVWYTYKELQFMYQCDIAHHRQAQQQIQEQRQARRRHSLVSQLQQQQQQQQPNHDESSICWRGLEGVVNNKDIVSSKKPGLDRRNSKVRDTVRQLVARHYECVAKELPPLNDELCHVSEQCTLADRQRAIDWAIQDAKDVGIVPTTAAATTRLSDFSRRVEKLSRSPPKHIRKASNILSKKIVAALPWGQ